MISRALNALGLVTRTEHDAEKLRITNSYATRIFGLEDDLRVSRERLKIEADAGAEAEERFKLAATDLAKQAEEIALVTVSRNLWREEANELRHDANMWRNSLKRSRDRKKGAKS